ncbi:hypothetical protein HELRODRAFT_177907 [Helobdella robusta]|uniref:Uncharacterized protein n=1 Tax=Helobdella robusta TaxID=6412 RepID=T1FCG4_HELRO|nr:hypothetical protein HELRODRAFT_177907 [Helobdella robusta]ESN97484.1 hypothetical protein HELRODRAFT_177907 [Helobdella robusta]
MDKPLFLFTFVYSLNFLFRRNTRTDGHEEYIGCFSSVIPSSACFVDSYTECKTFCMDDENSYLIAFRVWNVFHFVDKDKTECYCVVRVDLMVSSSKCNMLCNNKIDNCGGEMFYSVFSIKKAPHLDFSHIMSLPFSNTKKCFDALNVISIQLCIAACSEMKFPHTILKDTQCCCALLMEGQCEKPSYDPSCHKFCEGDQTQICGGYQCLPIYSTFSQLVFQSGKSVFHHWQNSPLSLMNTPGSGGLCQEGWTDCFVQNGDCGEEFICKRLSVNGVQYAECFCSDDNYYTFGKCLRNHSY